MKRETFESLVKDEVLDSTNMLEYLLERFKIILLTSWSKNSIKTLERLFNIIIRVKEAQIEKTQEIIARETLETNP